MKKVLLFLILFFVPLFVSASYNISNLVMDVKLEESGDVFVTKYLVVSGTFNTFTEELFYKDSSLTFHSPLDFSSDAIYNGTSIEDIEVSYSLLLSDMDFASFAILPYQPFQKVYYESDALNQNYVESSTNAGKVLKLFYDCQEEVVVFKISYRIRDVLVLHKDVGELYFPFIQDEYDSDIENVFFKVTLPKKDESDFLRVWMHGDFTGNLEKINYDTFFVTFQKLSRKTRLDIRMTFDQSILKSVKESKKTLENAFPKILEIEGHQAKETSEARKIQEKRMKKISNYSYLFLILLLFWWVFVYFHYGKESKSHFTSKYFMEFIEDYNVEDIEYLFHMKVSTQSFLASILHLIWKKNIVLQKKGEYCELLLKQRKNLSNSETILCDFLFERIGNSNKISLSQVVSFATSRDSCKTFSNSYHNWVRCVIKDAEQQKFYEQHGMPIITSIFLLLISFFLVFASIYFRVSLITPWLCFFFSFLFFFYSMFLKKKTLKGVEDYTKWKAFLRFLEDFSKFSMEELPKKNLWRKYLVYAMELGCFSKVLQSMREKMDNFELFSLEEYLYKELDRAFIENETLLK